MQTPNANFKCKLYANLKSKSNGEPLAKGKSLKAVSQSKIKDGEALAKVKFLKANF